MIRKSFRPGALFFMPMHIFDSGEAPEAVPFKFIP